MSYSPSHSCTSYSHIAGVTEGGSRKSHVHMIVIMDYSSLQTQIWVLLLLLTVDTNYGADLPVTVTGYPLTGTSISLTCTVPSFAQTAEWKNSALGPGAIQSCTKSFCLPTNPTYPGYTFASNTTDFTITIANATLNDNIWTCEHNTSADSSGPQTLNLKVPPTACTLTESGGIYTCTSSCGYPANVMSIRAKLNGTSNTQELTSLTAISAPACTNPESAYSANVPTSFFTKSADLYCECGVIGFESTFTQSNSVAVTATTTTTTPASSSSICDSCTTTYVLAALGIVFAVVCIVFCWMVYLQRSGKFQGPCSVFTKSKCSVKQTLIAAIIATSLCVIGIILCIVGLVTLIVALAVVGFVLPVFTHVIVIILLTFFCCGKIMEKDGGNPEHTETTQVNSKNVTDDEKYVKKGETTDGKKATEVETKGSDKNDKVDKKGEKTNVIKPKETDMKGTDKNDKVDNV